MLYGLTPRTARELRRKLDDGGRVGKPPASGAATRGVTWILVTDEPTDGWHPAVVTMDVNGTWVDLEDEVLVAAADESDLAVDQRYLCTRTGDDDGVARFRTTPSPNDLQETTGTATLNTNDWFDIGSGITLSAGGIFLVSATITARGTVSALGSLPFVVGSIYTGSTYIKGIYAISPQVTGVEMIGTGSVTFGFEPGGSPVTLTLRAVRQSTGGTTWSGSPQVIDSSGMTVLRVG